MVDISISELATVTTMVIFIIVHSCVGCYGCSSGHARSGNNIRRDQGRKSTVYRQKIDETDPTLLFCII
jgi:hypothetical protein